VSEPCGDQHEGRVAVGEGADDPGSSSDLAHQPVPAGCWCEDNASALVAGGKRLS
jgi:hypothetical protein